MVRTGVVLVLVLGVVPAGIVLAGSDDKAPQGPDELGFPITFNDSIITRRDVLTALGAPEAELGAGGLTRDDRDGFLMDRLVERVGQIYDLHITEDMVERKVQREIDRWGGEARFFQTLAQRGETPESYREFQRRQILKELLQYLLVEGFPGKRLPWSLEPTPRELRIAWENDSERRAAVGVTVHVFTHVVNFTKAENQELTQRFMKLDLDEDEEKAAVAQERERLVVPRLEAFLRDLKGGRAFDELARERGGLGDQWLPIPRGATLDPQMEFLATAREGATSEPITLPEGGFLLVHLVERRDVSKSGPADANVIRQYRRLIMDLRTQKADALMKLQAVNRSTIEPPKVRREFRQLLLDRLKEAEERLRALGLH